MVIDNLLICPLNRVIRLTMSGVNSFLKQIESLENSEIIKFRIGSKMFAGKARKAKKLIGVIRLTWRERKEQRIQFFWEGAIPSPKECD